MEGQKIYVVIRKDREGDSLIGAFSDRFAAESIALKYPDGNGFVFEELEIDALLPDLAQGEDYFRWIRRVWVQLPLCSEVETAKELRAVSRCPKGDVIHVYSNSKVCQGHPWLLVVFYYEVNENEAKEISIKKAKDFLLLTSHGISENEAVSILN